jgi:hypothetical protein
MYVISSQQLDAFSLVLLLSHNYPPILSPIVQGQGFAKPQNWLHKLSCLEEESSRKLIGPE